MDDKKIEVDASLIEELSDWWRSANESPGGISALAAINGMRDAVLALEDARKEQLGIRELPPDVAAKIKQAMDNPDLLTRIERRSGLSLEERDGTPWR